MSAPNETPRAAKSSNTRSGQKLTPFRVIHILVWMLVISGFLAIPWSCVQSARQEAEGKRIDAVQSKLDEKLRAYHHSHGEYPASLQAITFTNSPEEIQMRSTVQKLTYLRTEHGYTITNVSGSYLYLSVSNNTITLAR